MACPGKVTLEVTTTSPERGALVLALLAQVSTRGSPRRSLVSGAPSPASRPSGDCTVGPALHRLCTLRGCASAGTRGITAQLFRR